jgi:hypothetical protein
MACSQAALGSIRKALSGCQPDCFAQEKRQNNFTCSQIINHTVRKWHGIAMIYYIKARYQRPFAEKP